MKILVTGSNGLLGQKIIYALLKLNAGQKPIGNCDWPKVKGIGIIASSKGENRLIQKAGYHYEPLDICDKNQVQEVLARHRPDVVINTAAMTNVDACETQRTEAWDANVTAVQNIVESLTVKKSESLATDFYDPLLIHISTDFIFDGEHGPYKEEDQANPLSYYALTKWEGEKVVQSSQLRWTILRTIIVYGIVDNMSRSNVVLWAKDALAKGQKINVVDDQFRSPTLSEDLAQGCILAALKGKQGIYNVSGKDILSILELVSRVADFWKLDKSTINPVKSDTLHQAAKRPPRTGFIIDKAIKELGYVPHSFEEGLAILDAQLP